MIERSTKQIAAHASELTGFLLAAARGFEVNGYPPNELTFHVWTELTEFLLEEAGWTANELCAIVRSDDGEDKACT